ncbi:hypothetical protein UY3_16406 [Chelonia mydas]|uniref:Uncharacterized protein n=1 Tax=Chelonia mydas TaxID=8469 RepID=M7BE68_CHEMY|nr:hypothetical protein UY3_16406 [Chelonia mydas]
MPKQKPTAHVKNIGGQSILKPDPKPIKICGNLSTGFNVLWIRPLVNERFNYEWPTTGLFVAHLPSLQQLAQQAHSHRYQQRCFGSERKGGERSLARTWVDPQHDVSEFN